MPTSGTLQVDVREKHGGDCGGDPNTAPRLFSFEVDLTTGSVASDAGSISGEMQLLADTRIAP